jgi:hypothetical protein
VAQVLVNTAQDYASYVDESIAITFGQEAIIAVAEVLDRDIDPKFIFNCISTPFGRGILLGMVAERFMQLELEQAEEEADGQNEEQE